METNIMCNPMLGAPVAVVVDVPAYVGRTRTLAPIAPAPWQSSARVQSALLVASGMRPTTVDAAPKHAPRTFAPSGNRNWSPPV